MPDHAKQVAQLTAELVGNTERLRVKKKTVSNLFRYGGRGKVEGRQIDLSDFNQPLQLDARAQTLDVQGLATYEQIVDYCLPQGFLPLVTPELKHITVGGAMVGIGIETNSFRYGFVHDGVLAVQVLLPTGQVVEATANNDYADLFYGLPNSYGTLGYILRVKLKLRRVQPYVRLTTTQFSEPQVWLDAMKSAAADPANDYVDGLVYSSQRLYLTVARDSAEGDQLGDIYRGEPFYKQISRPGEFTLATKDFMFRYDPDWFWNIGETGVYGGFRQWAPKALRNSAFYTRFRAWQKRFGSLSDNPEEEELIQDWEVPWREAGGLLGFALTHIDLDGRPMLGTPLKTPAHATLYPIKPELYFNLGSYGRIKKPADQPLYQATRQMDDYCFAHGGTKMLYSSTFLARDDFDQHYNGSAYRKLKAKYDPQGLAPILYDKVVHKS